ncbi:MAG: metallophosphoesterase family protein [Acetobacteraceae bacterium]
MKLLSSTAMVTFRLAPARLGPGRRIYAIGDVHGMAQRLFAMHEAIAVDLAARPCAIPLVLHIGDYIDRGPESAAILARLASNVAIAGAQTICLTGNHESMALGVLLGGDDEAARLWRMNGADATLRSWRIDPSAPHQRWARGIPSEQLEFLEALRLFHRDGDYFFVHAGLRPGVALADQDAEDLVWIREPFLSYRGDFGVVVVHGHTPTKAPVVRANRIGIDTGAVFGGALTAAVLEEDRLGFLQV